MSIIATAVKHLIAAGVTGDALVAAIAEMEASIDTRSTGAKRQARYRERLADKASQSVTKRNSDASKEKSPQTPLKENTPLSPKGDIPPLGTKSSGRNDHPAKPDDVAEQTWRDFVTHRKAKKAPVTETALDGIRREAVKAGWSMNAALAETVTRGWQSFRADWATPAQPAATGAPGSFLASLSGGP